MLRDLLQALTVEASIPGASLAVVRNGETVVACAGVRDIVAREPVDDRTLFDAASLSKPMVAYAALQLVDCGILDLDAPLSKYVPPIVSGDAASEWLSARHILAHTSGLPNLRGKEPLKISFHPGTRFSYSSLGFTYLQSAIESMMGEPLETTMRKLVFEPLNMGSSSFEWQARFGTNVATPHERGDRINKHYPAVANASYSLQTTAADYGAFISAVLSGARLKRSTHQDWLRPIVNVPKGSATNLENNPLDTVNDIAWGLGWGLEYRQGTFFQWGKMSGVRAFVMGSLDEQTGVVLFANSNTGLRVLGEITKAVLPGEHPAVGWLKACVSE